MQNNQSLSHKRIRTHIPGEAEVAELEDLVLGEQQVLRLDIPVDAVVGVAVADGLQHLPRDPLRQLLRNADK